MHDFQKIAISWACQQAKAWGWTWKTEGTMIWVNTGESEIGCVDWHDFVAFVSEERKERARNAA